MEKDERIKKDIEHLERCEHLGIDHALGQESLDRIDLYHDLQKANARILELKEEQARLYRDRNLLLKVKNLIGNERDQLKLDLAEADSIISSISEPTWSDERVRYLDVQISREDYKKLQEYLAKRGKNG